MDIELGTILTMILSAISFGFAPFNKTLIGICLTLFVNGFALGVYDVFANFYVLGSWGDRNPPFVQILQLMYGFGALLAPLLAEPFLVNNIELNVNGNSTITVVSPIESYSQIHWPYVITAIYGLVTSGIFAIVYLRTKTKRRQMSTQFSVERPNDLSKINRKVRIAIIVLTSLFIHFYFSLQIVTGTFVIPYLVKANLIVDKSQGAYINSLYWLCFTFCRLPSIYVMKKIGIEKALVVQLSIIVLSMIVLFIYGSTSLVGICVGIGLLGMLTTRICRFSSKFNLNSIVQ